ncbi:TIR domain-containing protein [Oligosphaera ethanolica]|uniref:Tetratricopeptide (TPR) repeat protein n=1 Tax=Oligosphaera ethanolica TaxID=760260 RepID=A0AAE3VHK6_9BACT|nr:TIR domain-containing protein [Oligosphaera ethanolica]MDQ0290520.1 tetratricopeptide (TPR) repeat protein [Oligosphaera ethanolica]
MVHEPYKYVAFISYSRKDERVARWLQSRLEWFRFPVKLVSDELRPGHPKYVRPVYRDKTDLDVTRAHYWDTIHQAIDASRFLIVLCSPAAAQSGPVDQEIRHFLNNPARQDAVGHLLPVVVGGTLDGKDGDGCLGPALAELKDRLIVRNLPTMLPDADEREKDSWENGFVGVVSFLLGVDRKVIGDHCRREERRRARRAGLLAAVFALLAIAAIGGGAYAWRQRNEAQRQRDLATAAENRAINNLATSYVSSSRAALARREPLVAAQLAESAVDTAPSLASRLAYWESICALPAEHPAYAIPDVVRDNVCVLAPNQLAVADTTTVYRFEDGRETGRLAHGSGVVLDLVREDNGQIWGVGEAGAVFAVSADFCSLKRVYEVGNKCASLSVTKDGRRLAIGRQDGTALLLAVRTGGVLKVEHEISVGGQSRGSVFVSLSGDGTRLYAALNADAGHVSAYDTADGQQVWRQATERPGRIAVSASGRYMAWYATDGMVVAVLAQGQRFLQFASGKSLFGRLSFSPDETCLAYAASDVGASGRIEELNLASGTAQCLYQAPCKLATVQYAAPHRLLAAGLGEGQWVDLSTVRQTQQTSDLVWRVTAQADNSLRAFACGRPNWLDPQGGTLTRRMATRSIGITLEQWPYVRGWASLLGMTGMRAELTEWGLPTATVCGDVLPDGRAVIGLKDGTVALYHEGKTQEVGKLPGTVGHLRAGPAGLLLMAPQTFGDTVRLVRMTESTVTVVAEIPGSMPVTASAFTPDGVCMYVARSSPLGRINDGVIVAVETNAGKILGEASLRACGTVRDLLVLPDGPLLAALASGELAVLDRATMALHHTVPVVDAPLFRLAQFPGEDQTVVTGDEEGVLHVVNLVERKVAYSTRAMGVPVTALCTSPKEWVVAFGNRIECWSRVGDLEFTRQQRSEVRIWSAYDLQQQAKTARESGNVELALRLYRQIQRLQPRQIPFLMEIVELQAELRRYKDALGTFAEVAKAGRAQGMSDAMLQQYSLRKMMLLKAWWEADGNVETLNGAMREAVSFLFDNPGNGAIHLVPMSLLMSDGRSAEACAGLMALYPLLSPHTATPDMTLTRSDAARFATICALAAGIDPAAARARLAESWDAGAAVAPQAERDALKALYLGQPHGDIVATRNDWKATEKARVHFLLGMEAKQAGLGKQAAEHFEQGRACGDWHRINRHALASVRGERTNFEISNENVALYRAVSLLISTHMFMNTGDCKQAFQAAQQAWNAVETLPKTDPDRGRFLPRVAVSLTWTAALSGQPADAIISAEACLPFLPPDTPEPLLMNLAHAYLFNGQFEKAQAIYTKYLGTAFEDGRTWNDELRNDFKLLREAGQDHPDMKRIEALLGIQPAEDAK